MLARDYAEKLRASGHSFETIRVLLQCIYGKTISIQTIYYWCSPARRESIRKYQRRWQAEHRAALKAGKKPGKPVVEYEKFQTHGPFEGEGTRRQQRIEAAKQLRREGLTQQAIADRLGVHQTTVGQWLKPTKNTPTA
jgi:transposase